MTTEIHAHKVLNLLREQPMSEQVLRDAVYKQFGQETQFRTCKCSGFDFDALFSFFIQREKSFKRMANGQSMQSKYVVTNRYVQITFG